MTETVKSENYTNKPLQKDSNPTTMEVVTQTNAVKSPTDTYAENSSRHGCFVHALCRSNSLRTGYAGRSRKCLR